MAYTLEQIKKVESDAIEFIENTDSVVIKSGKGTVLVSKALVDSKNTPPKIFKCLKEDCGAEITLKKNPNVNYASRFPKRWLKFNLDGSEHKHPRKKKSE